MTSPTLFPGRDFLGAEMSPQESQAIISLVRTFQMNSYFLFACFVLIFYDFFLMLPLEISVIWQREWNGGTVLYLLMRYSLLLFNILLTVLAFYLIMSNYILYTASVLLATSFATQLIILMLRTYAISGKNRVVLAILVVIGLAISGLGLYTEITAVISVLRTGFQSIHDEFSRSLVAMSILTFIFDTLVYLFTVKHTYKWNKLIGQNIEGGVLPRMYRDGTKYYLALLTINVATIVFSFIDAKYSSGLYYIIYIYQIELGIILTARLVLDLKYVARKTAGGDSIIYSSISLAEVNVNSLDAP